MAVNKNPLYAILKRRLTDCWHFMGSFVVALVYRIFYYGKAIIIALLRTYVFNF